MKQVFVALDLGFLYGQIRDLYTWRVGGLSNWLVYGPISTITPIRVSFGVLISLLTTYLLSPQTL